MSPNNLYDVIHTTDGGETWERLISTSNFQINQVYFTDLLNGWGVGSSGKIIYTNDGGLSWQDLSSGTNDFNAIFFVDQNNGWIAGNSLSILHTDNGGSTGISKPINQNSSASLRIKIQNYPNPTRGIVDCQFGIVDCRRASLKIYDLHGREVADVMDEKMQAGEHSVQFDLSALPDGIYLVRVQAGDEAVTGKLVLQKQ